MRQLNWPKLAGGAAARTPGDQLSYSHKGALTTADSGYRKQDLVAGVWISEILGPGPPGC
jgi:hypothetical protein